jgi:hypothetical protein
VLTKAISTPSAWQPDPVVVMAIKRGVGYKVILAASTGSGLASKKVFGLFGTRNGAAWLGGAWVCLARGLVLARSGADWRRWASWRRLGGSRGC